MPAVKGRQHIRGWREHSLIRDLAANDLSVEALAEKYGVEVDTIYHFKERHKPQIAEVLADWSNEFAGMWIARKETRIADLKYLAESIQERMDELVEDAERATETMRTVDPDAAPVRVPVREWQSLEREKARLDHQVAEEMGQLPTRIAVDQAPVRNPITDFEVLAVDADGNFHAVKQ